MPYKSKINHTLDNVTTNLKNAQKQIKLLNKNSLAWQSPVFNEYTRQRYATVIVLFIIRITPLITKYHHKKTIQGEFIADVLEDYYYDLIQRPLDGLDDELEEYRTDFNPTTNMSNHELNDAMYALILNLYSRCQHPKKLVKILKHVYQDHKTEIDAVTKQDDTTKPDLNAIVDISANYRDYLY